MEIHAHDNALRGLWPPRGKVAAACRGPLRRLAADCNPGLKV
jgi:hypothetical protein